MSEPKTKVNKASVTKFLDSISDDAMRTDSHSIVEMLRTATKAEPQMWGSSIVGFDVYHYVGKSGREGDWLLAGMSPRKQSLTLYILGGWDHSAELLAKLGKHSLGKGCLYIKRLDGVHLPVLKRLVADSLKRAKKLAQAEATKQAQQRKR